MLLLLDVQVQELFSRRTCPQHRFWPQLAIPRPDGDRRSEQDACRSRRFKGASFFSSTHFYLHRRVRHDSLEPDSYTSPSVRCQTPPGGTRQAEERIGRLARRNDSRAGRVLDLASADASIQCRRCCEAGEAAEAAQRAYRLMMWVFQALRGWETHLLNPSDIPCRSPSPSAVFRTTTPSTFAPTGFAANRPSRQLYI